MRWSGALGKVLWSVPQLYSVSGKRDSLAVDNLHCKFLAVRRMDPIWCSCMSLRICGVTVVPSNPIYHSYELASRYGNSKHDLP